MHANASGLDNVFRMGDPENVGRSGGLIENVGSSRNLLGNVDSSGNLLENVGSSRNLLANVDSSGNLLENVGSSRNLLGNVDSSGDPENLDRSRYVLEMGCLGGEGCFPLGNIQGASASDILLIIVGSTVASGRRLYISSAEAHEHNTCV
ncbi:hypothetical protein THAR02_06341 [Trichoderma harzianum]|uniref:Uncharacterized protein n=1 Tax=Trichoderma harzianum TaxID=5544 RepID=A0A0F9X8N8_TRIHA|nr:hypothetical protein THAR02_06341 [Trichoderma harzianum]